MAAGRSQRPLFDLISTKDSAGDASRRAATAAASSAAANHDPSSTFPKPTVRVELKPRDASRPTIRDGASYVAPAEPSSASTPVAPATLDPATSEPRAKAEHPDPRTHPVIATGSPASGALGAMLGDQTVRLPRNVIFLAIAGVILLLVAVWAIATNRGESRATKALEKQFAAEPAPLVREPTATSAPALREPQPPSPAPAARSQPSASAGSGSAQNPTRRPQSPPPNPAPTAGQPANPTTAVITARGYLDADPREHGLNYCILATLQGPDAKRVVDFLAEQGLEAIGVPVDGRGRSGNNQGPQLAYQVIALPGITREEYAQKRTARTNLEASVTRLGQIWQREHRGSSNFARFSWDKYE